MPSALYVEPAQRRSGLAHALGFLSMLLAWDAGAEYFIAENGAVTLRMARDLGFTDTGIITKRRGEVAYHLMIGRTNDVLAASFAGARRAIAQLDLGPDIAAAMDRMTMR